MSSLLPLRLPLSKPGAFSTKHATAAVVMCSQTTLKFGQRARILSTVAERNSTETACDKSNKLPKSNHPVILLLVGSHTKVHWHNFVIKVRFTIEDVHGLIC